MHIVVATKPDTVQPWLTDAVLGVARQTDATVAVVAVDQVELERLASAPRSVYVERAEETVTAVVRLLTEAGIETTGTVLPGRPVQRILEFADEQNADL
ncbi:MAG TPA: universal stress protein, partial [Actinoplanes sp.]